MMMRLAIQRSLLALAVTLLPIGSVLAANCSSNPFTLTNGQTADATQVMSNFNNLLNCANNNLAHNGANSDITSLTGITTPIPVAEGGTGLASSGPAGDILISNGSGFAVATVLPMTSGGTGTTLGPHAVLLQTQTVNNTAALQFTSSLIGVLNEYIIVYSHTLPSVAGGSFGLRISQDGGASYKAGVNDYKWARQTNADNATASAGGSIANSLISLWDSSSSTSTNVLAGEIHLFDSARVGDLKNIQFTASSINTGGNFALNSGAGMYVGNSSATNALELFFTTGNISTGVFSLYGVIN